MVQWALVKLFLPQATLEEWAAAEKADLQEGKLELAGAQASFPVVTAVHFHKLLSGSDDQKLLHKVKTGDQLKALGAEQMADSVLLGETAYEVTEGYLAEVQAAAVSEPAPAPRRAGNETDLLAAFLLDKLS